MHSCFIFVSFLSSIGLEWAWPMFFLVHSSNVCLTHSIYVSRLTDAYVWKLFLAFFCSDLYKKNELNKVID